MTTEPDSDAKLSRRGLLQSTSAVTLAGLAVACGRSAGPEVSGEPSALKLPPPPLSERDREERRAPKRGRRTNASASPWSGWGGSPCNKSYRPLAPARRAG